MKSSGFDIEATHLSDKYITGLVAKVCIALVWAYLVGEHKNINIKPFKMLNNGYRAKSLFRFGLK